MSNIGDAFMGGLRNGLTGGAGAAGIVFQGAVQGIEDSLNDPDVKTAATEAIANGVQAATVEAVNNFRAGFDQIRDNLGEGLNVDNVSLWSAVKDRVTGGTTGLKKALRYGLAGMLWGGLTLASFVGVGFIRRSHLKDDAEIPQTASAIRRMIAGTITPNRNFDRGQLDQAANLVIG